MDRLELKSAALIGHSFGGMVAAEIAAAMPERARRLVLIDPVGLWRDDLPVKNWMLHNASSAFPAARVRTRGFGDTVPLADNRSGEGRIHVGGCGVGGRDFTVVRIAGKS